MTQVLHDIEAVRAACDDVRRRSGTVGFVPTMGALHVGHLSLASAARAEHDLVVVSIFVNPLQFGPSEDLAAYPRDLDGDVAQAQTAGVDIVFAPSAQAMYPDGPPRTTVHVDGLTDGLCGAVRPTHFDGVTTVCAKLFAIVGPCRAYFGRKDYQQWRVVARMAADLNLPVEVVGCPLVRERDGLALSSRNRYLTPDEREAATVLSRALRAVVAAVDVGTTEVSALTALVARACAEEPLVDLEYCEVRTATDLVPVDEIAGEVVVAVAARVGADGGSNTRLIDNCVITLGPDGATADLGTIGHPSGERPDSAST